MARIALFGGGFNPIGRHHEFAALTVHEETGRQVWLMPCCNHQFDKNKDLIETAHRWNMVEMVANSYGDAIQACDWELKHQSSGKMFETIQSIRNDFPDHQFSVVIGMDNANILLDDKLGWSNGQWLVENVSFIVLTCEGVESTANWFRNKPHRVIDKHFSSSVRSSDIREACKAGNVDFVKQYTHPQVWSYIQSGKLFGLPDMTDV